MKKILNTKKAFVKYFCEFNKILPIINLIQIALVANVVLFVIDEYDILTKFIGNLSVKVSAVLVVGSILLILLWFVNVHLIDLFKINTVNVVDKIFFILLLIGAGTSTYWCVFGKTGNYKFITTITFSVMIIAFWSLKIIIYVINEIRLSKYRKDVYDLQQIYENNFELNDNEPLLISEKDVCYDLLNRDTVTNQLYNSIISYNPENSFVIGLEGEWGSGKTTIINNVKLKLNNEENIVCCY